MVKAQENSPYDLYYINLHQHLLQGVKLLGLCEVRGGPGAADTLVPLSPHAPWLPRAAHAFGT